MPRKRGGGSVVFVLDTFGGGETGAAWTRHPGQVGAGGALVVGGVAGFGAQSTWYASGIPPSSDYAVSADFVGGDGNSALGIHARFSKTDYAGYMIQKYQGNAQLYRMDPSLSTLLGQVNKTGLNGRVTLKCLGDVISVQWDGVEIISAVDATYAAPGAVCLMLSSGSSAATLGNYRAQT